MFKWLAQRNAKGNDETGEVSVRSLIQKAVRDAEEITDSIKMRAQAEAQDEAARIIDLARQDAEEIKRSVEAVARKEAEDIISAASREVESVEAETQQKVRLFLLKARRELENEVGMKDKQVHSRLLSSLQQLIKEEQDEVIEQPVRLDEEVVSEKKEEPFLVEEEEAPLPEPVGAATEEQDEVIEEPVRLDEEVVSEKVQEPLLVEEEEAPLPEPVGATTEDIPEQDLPENKPYDDAPPTVQLKPEDREALYSGEIELMIAAPVELPALTKFYNYLQTLSDIKILYTRGSWNSGTTITVALDNPIPLISVVLKTPGVVVTPELYREDNLVSEISSSLLSVRRRRAKRLKLVLREG
jgi:vacuolar-type H+-ATPase subunit E/Vma4